MYAPGERTFWARHPPPAERAPACPSIGHELVGPAALPTFAAGSAALGAAVGRALGNLVPAGASWLFLPVRGGGGMEAPPFVGHRCAPGAAPGLCGLRCPLGVAGHHLKPLALLSQGVRMLAQEEGGRP